MQSLLRRPSAWLFLGAGLLAADLLLSTGWTDATTVFACVALTGVFGYALRRRTPHRREVEITVLPLSHAIEPDARRRVMWFVLFLAALIVVPVAFAIASR